MFHNGGRKINIGKKNWGNGYRNNAKIITIGNVGKAIQCHKIDTKRYKNLVSNLVYGPITKETKIRKLRKEKIWQPQTM